MQEILEDREKRYHKTLELIEEHKLPVLCAKLNYPGKNKNTELAMKGFGILRKEIIDTFTGHAVKLLELEGFDGSAILVALRLDPHEAKRAAVKLEERHELGRIFDIDVYVKGGDSISRTELGLEERKCILCGDNARVCMRGRTHPLEEVVDTVDKLIMRCE